MIVSTWTLQRRWQRLQRPIALILLMSGALLLWSNARADVPTEPTLVAARDVPAGHVLTAADVTVAQWPLGVRPTAAVASPAAVLERRTTSAISAGEPLTAQRVVGPSSLAAVGADQVAVLLPEDPLAASGLVRPGDRVDVVGQSREGVRTLVAGATVLTVGDDAGLIVAVPATAAPAVLQAAGSESVAAVLRG